jgi:hypothetical protein
LIDENSLRRPRLFNADLAFLEAGSVDQRVDYEFQTEFFNAFNNLNFNNSDAGLQEGNLGQTNSGGSPRILQMALRFKF